MRRSASTVIAFAAGAVLALVSVVAAHADWPEKPITIVVPYSPGGGFDSYVRAVVPEMERILGTEVVVKNVSGAGGQRGAVTIYRADPDGYTIGIWNVPGLILPRLLGEDPGYDIGQVSWIGNIATSRHALAVKADSPYRTIEELCAIGRPVKHSDNGRDTSSIAAELAFELIDCEHASVTGYKGSTEAVLAVMRGEVDATVKTEEALLKYVDAGDLRLLMTFEDEPSLSGVPSSTEAGHPEYAQFRMQRLIGGPPGMPADIVQRLSDALMGAARSEEVQEWSASAGYPLDPMPAAEAQAMMEALMGFYEGYRPMLEN